MDDILNLENELGISLSLLIEANFTRNNPKDNEVAFSRHEKTLNLSEELDCQTKNELMAFTDINCTSDPTAS